MKKLLFLINSLSGSGRGKVLAKEIAAEMQGRIPAHDYAIVFTTPEVTRQARNLAPQYEIVIAAGGDGTLNHIARGIIESGKTPHMGIIPLGTGNDLARSLGLFDLVKHKGLGGLTDLFLTGNTRPVDVYTLGEHHMFINYTGFGRDAAIAAAFDRMRKRAPYRTLCSFGFSKPLYALITAAYARETCAPGIELSYQKSGGSTETLHINDSLCQLLISSIDSYGGGTRISSSSRMDDGQFEITVMLKSSRWLLLHLSRFTGKTYDGLVPAGSVIRAHNATLCLPQNIPAQIDGETVEIEPELQMDIRKTAQLQVLAPPPS